MPALSDFCDLASSYSRSSRSFSLESTSNASGVSMALFSSCWRLSSDQISSPAPSMSSNTLSCKTLECYCGHCFSCESCLSMCLRYIYRFGQSYHGMMALQTGFLVAFTQLIPEHQVQLFGGLAKLRVKVICPSLYTCCLFMLNCLSSNSPCST